MKKRSPIPVPVLYSFDHAKMKVIKNAYNHGKKNNHLVFTNRTPNWITTHASHGVSSGRVFYEVTVTKIIRGGICRVGWSTVACNAELGREEGSFGYGGTGWKSNDNSFTRYGKMFGINDTIGCAIDLEQRNISYFKNGKSLGIAFEFSLSNEV